MCGTFHRATDAEAAAYRHIRDTATAIVYNTSRHVVGIASRRENMATRQAEFWRSGFASKKLDGF